MTREELREHCERQIRVCETWSKAAGVPKGKVYDEHKLILELLDNEHKPGKWIIDRMRVRGDLCHYSVHCSECSWRWDFTIDKSMSGTPSKFCPNCGARMEKEVQDNG
jgi:hypothetical protein